MGNVVLGVLGASILLNAYLAFRFYQKKHVLTIDAKALLRELLQGKSVVEVRVLDTAGLMFRSPRG